MIGRREISYIYISTGLSRILGPGNKRLNVGLVVAVLFYRYDNPFDGDEHHKRQLCTLAIGVGCTLSSRLG